MTKSTNKIPSLASKPDMWEDEPETIGDWAASAGPIVAGVPELHEGWAQQTAHVPGMLDDPLEAAVEVSADRCWNEAEALGWHASLDDLKKRLRRGEATEQEYLGWIQAKMLLIIGEICEAQEERRNGRDVNEVYYSFLNPDGSVETFDEQVFVEGVPQYKPEGWLVEMADARIRLDDLVGAIAGTEGVMFGPVVAGKLQYNATRGVMHGGKKF